MMKIGGTAAALAVLMLSTAAQAADTPVMKPYAAPVPVRDWSGPYYGLGVSFGTSDYEARPAPGALPLTTWDADGFGLAGLLGYNLQHGRFLYGIEGQLSWPNIEGSPANIGGAGPGTSEIEWIASLRGRAGYLLRDDLLVYVTGGYARARGELSAAGFVPPTTRHATHSGWTAGIGGEWQFAPGMRIRAAVDRYEFDARTYNSYGGPESNYFFSLMFLGGLNLFGTNIP